MYFEGLRAVFHFIPYDVRKQRLIGFYQRVTVSIKQNNVYTLNGDIWPDGSTCEPCYFLS